MAYCYNGPYVARLRAGPVLQRSDMDLTRRVT